MRNGMMTLAAALFVGATSLGAAGCGGRNEPEPMPRSRIPERPPPVPLRERDEYKPLPDNAGRGSLPAPPYDDVPLVNQRPPEQRAFVESYNAVGKPRILVFVNRTLEGELVPVNREEPYVSVERSRTSRGDVRIETRDSRSTDDRFSRDDRDREDRFESRGPAELRDRVDVYLQPGEYDEVDARAIDYEAMENVLTDWLASEGRVEIVSPVMARQRLSDEQVKELQAGRPTMMGEVAKLLDADVLVQVQARPTRQTRRGLEVRVTAEAINVGSGGQSIARAMVEVPPPLDKPQLNKYTRFLARKLMDGMTGSWRVAAADERANPRRDRPGATQPGSRPADPPPDEPREPGVRHDPSDLRDNGPASQDNR